MKKIILTFIIILTGTLCFGQDWLWARQIGGSSTVSGGAQIDADKNIYCSGIFMGNCYFEHDTLIAVGSDDIFLAKFDENGNELWAKRIGGANPNNVYESVSASIIDINYGFLYITGRFYGSLTIDGHTVNSTGGLDIFLAKFDLMGNCLWLKKAGSYGDDNNRALCLDNNGNIYFTGQLYYSGSFESISLPVGTFLSKLDPDGNIVWARNEISQGTVNALKIANNEIIMVGNTGNFSVLIDTIPLVSTNQVDGFIAKFDINGNCIKAKRFGGHLPNYACDFDVDSLNNIYVTGFFCDTLTIEGITVTNISNNNHDMFFCKFDSAFNLVWIRQSYCTGDYGAIASIVVKDSQGKFYVSGYYGGNSTFGTYNVSSSVTRDMFLARYDENGDCLGVRHFGEATGESVNIDSFGNLIVAGDFVNTVNIGDVVLTSIGGSNLFFAKATPITGISEMRTTANNNLLIYANPSTGKCNITVPDEFVNEPNLTLSIFDNAGKLIQQQKLEMSENKIKLNLEAEAKGIYTAVLSNSKKSYTGKIVFE